MSVPELVRYLRKTALEPAFRALAQSDPEASFEGFELGEDHRKILVRQDQAAFDLLSLAVQSTFPQTPERAAEPPASAAAAAPAAQVLPTLTVWLRLAPVQTTEGLRHQVTLATEPTTEPGVASYRIEVGPIAEERGEMLAIHYTVDLIPEMEPSAPPTSLWDHQIDSPVTRQAAERALTAPPAERRAALEALVQALSAAP